MTVKDSQNQPTGTISRTHVVHDDDPDPDFQPDLDRKGDIENVIFDFGNVLVSWDPKAALISRYSDDLIDQFLTDSISGFWTYNHETDRGVPSSIGIAHMRESHGDIWADILAWYSSHFADSLIGVVPGARQLVQDLKEAGIHVWGLSNWSDETFPIVWENYPILHEMEDKVISGYVDAVKPSPEIFHVALEQFGISAHSSVFIDDTPRNVVAARNVGIAGIIQTSPQKVRAELVRLGVNIPAVRED
jgi:putative hydrolase of the HAD superfamily